MKGAQGSKTMLELRANEPFDAHIYMYVPLTLHTSAKPLLAVKKIQNTLMSQTQEAIAVPV